MNLTKKQIDNTILTNKCYFKLHCKNSVSIFEFVLQEIFSNRLTKARIFKKVFSIFFAKDGVK